MSTTSRSCSDRAFCAPNLVLAVIAGLVLMTLCHPARTRADDLETLARQLASEDRGRTKAAIEQLGRQRDPAALRILEALEGRRLRATPTGGLWIERADGVVDALTGRAASAPARSTDVALTNATRRAVRSAIARLRLWSDDPEIRRAGARVLAESPDPDLTADVHRALEDETDAETQQLLSLSIAQLDLTSDDPDRRLSAVRTISEVGALSLKPQLKALTARGADGRPVEPDPRVRDEAARAVQALELEELLVRMARDVFYGISLGSVLLLAALGLAITFGLMGVINMAHGEMIMLGAYATYVVQSGFATSAPAARDWYLVAALPVAFSLCFLVGVLLERTVIRFLYGRPLETLLATWGISLILIQLVRVTFGAQNVTVANPSWLSGGWELVSGVVVPYARLAITAFVGAVVAFVWYLLRFTNLGLHVRAITQNRRMARCMGIPTARVDMMTFGLGSGVAGLAGVALSQIGNVGPELGQQYIVDSFMVVVVGGVGELAGAVVAALGLGTINKILEPVTGAVLGKILVLAFIILFIQRRPQGLFALKGRAAEG